jgi:hypothetical protein
VTELLLVKVIIFAPSGMPAPLSNRPTSVAANYMELVVVVTTALPLVVRPSAAVLFVRIGKIWPALRAVGETQSSFQRVDAQQDATVLAKQLIAEPATGARQNPCEHNRKKHQAHP